MLALLAAVENVVPPVPADTAVALGAFLSHRGVTSLPVVYAVTLIANIGGATGVYFAARRYGRRLFASRIGQRLLSPSALAVVEREYLRFGIIGIFFGRFLPGVRAVVPPFAGLANLGAWRALVPMATASAIWYGAVALIGAAIGAEWSRISVILGEVNQTLAIVGVAAALVVALLVIRRRRQGGRLWQALRRAMPGTDALPEAAPDAMTQAALALLEVAYADPVLPADERARISAELRSRWDLPHAEAREPADEAEWRGVRQRLLDQFGKERRCALVERLWTVAFAAPGSGESRARLVRNAAALLGMSTSEIADVESRVRATAARSV
ncbi:MAG TPA: VTT domain-containing protein [Gemmatimonadales bacterium]|nr:VTT domain-containing protein [Gemmatimonadales bacterium]